jgi:hypothetical protein
MRAVAFEGATHHFAPPRDWNADPNGPCETLSVRVSEPNPGINLYQSVWTFTDEERQRIAAGENVVLTVFNLQPAVALDVAAIPELKTIEVTPDPGPKTIPDEVPQESDETPA